MFKNFSMITLLAKYDETLKKLDFGALDLINYEVSDSTMSWSELGVYCLRLLRTRKHYKEHRVN
jgi:hypothetical protein